MNTFLSIPFYAILLSVGVVFLINMKFCWWEASAMLVLFGAQFVLPEIWGEHSRIWVAYILLGWSAAAVLKLLLRREVPPAFRSFAETWRSHLNFKS